MSDHISGPRALAEPAADITDLYAFTSPERPRHLSLVLNTRPFAETSDGLWEALVYRFRIRPLALANDENVPFVVSEEEFAFDCTFSAPTVRGSEIEQQGECRTPSGKTVPIQVGETSERDGVRIFAGARWDPFIMDARAALRTIETGQLAFQDTSSIYLDGKNVLSIVLEVDCAELLGGPGLVAVVGETLAKGVVEFRFERTGRPEVKNMLLAPKHFDQVNRDLEIRDLYNSEDAFRLAETYGGAFRARLNANLAFWDSLDGKVDWPTDAHGDHPLTDLILADFLAVDPSRPYVGTRLISRNRDGQSSGSLACYLRWPQHQRRCHGHALHAVGEWRQRAASPRWHRPGNEARSDGVSLSGISQSESSTCSPPALRVGST